MIAAKQIQNSYEKLYRGLREYIWPYPIVCNIADLEVATYKAFPDLQEIRNCCTKLKTSCFKQIREDEELCEKFENFCEVLNSDNTLYSKLNSRNEGVL